METIISNSHLRVLPSGRDSRRDHGNPNPKKRPKRKSVPEHGADESVNCIPQGPTAKDDDDATTHINIIA
jgi:hypothetical protein